MTLNSQIDELKKLRRMDLLKARKNFLGNKIYSHEKIMDYPNIPPFIHASNKIICGYYPMNDEINILPLLKYLSEKNTILIPKTIKGSRILEFGEIDFRKNISDQISTDNVYKIKEPILTIDKEDLHLDYILVPALGVDKNFQRIGYGGGYYDNTLSYYKEINNALVSVGICLSVGYFPAEEFLTNPYDKNLSAILTEKNYLELPI